MPSLGYSLVLALIGHPVFATLPLLRTIQERHTLKKPSGSFRHTSLSLAPAFQTLPRSTESPAPLPPSSPTSPTLARTNAAFDRDVHLLPGVVPVADRVIRSDGFTSGVSDELMMPVWVSEAVDNRDDRVTVTGQSGRDFYAAPPGYDGPAPTEDDYLQSSYDRGHMAAALNHRESRESLIQTMCLITNIVPQKRLLNNGVFQALEMKIHRWSKQAPLHLVTGPLWMVKDADGYLVPCNAACRALNRHKFETAGESKLLAPTHIFKIVRIMGRFSVTSGIFIFPNEEVPRLAPIVRFLDQITPLMSNLAVVNQVTGMDFSPYISESARDLAELLIERPPKVKFIPLAKLGKENASESLGEMWDGSELSSMFHH